MQLPAVVLGMCSRETFSCSQFGTQPAGSALQCSLVSFPFLSVVSPQLSPKLLARTPGALQWVMRWRAGLTMQHPWDRKTPGLGRGVIHCFLSAGECTGLLVGMAQLKARGSGWDS